MRERVDKERHLHYVSDVIQMVLVFYFCLHKDEYNHAIVVIRSQNLHAFLASSYLKH